MYLHIFVLFRYMDKHVRAKLNGGRVVEGTLRGFDPFLNLVLEDSTEIRKDANRVNIGTVVSNVLRRVQPGGMQSVIQ